MINEILQLPATISKVQTLANRCLKLTIDTQEDLNNEQIQKIISVHDRLGYFNFLVGEKRIEAEQLVDLPEIKSTDDEKTPAQRLRGRMFVYFKQTHKDTSDFDKWYSKYLNDLGQKFLNKLEE